MDPRRAGRAGCGREAGIARTAQASRTGALSGAENGMDNQGRIIAAAAVVLAEMLAAVASQGALTPGGAGGPFGPHSYGLAKTVLADALKTAGSR